MFKNIKNRTSPIQIVSFINSLSNNSPKLNNHNHADLEVVSHPCVLKTCIDISLDLGRVENKDIESLVNESIFCSENTIRLPRSLPATLTIAQESTISPTQQTVK